MLADSTLPAIRLCVYLHLLCPSSGKWSLRLLLLLCCGILHFNIIAELYLVHANGDRVVSYLLGRASNTPTPHHPLLLICTLHVTNGRHPEGLRSDALEWRPVIKN